MIDREKQEAAEARAESFAKAADRQALKRILEMGTESLSPDSFIDLERICGELRRSRKVF